MEMRKFVILGFITMISFSCKTIGSPPPAVVSQPYEISFFQRPPQTVSQDLFEKLLVLDPNEEDYYVAIGLGYLEKGQRGKAEEYFEKALKTNPKNYKPPLKIGVAYLKRGDTAKAEPMIQRAIQIKPKEENLYLG